MLLLLTKDAIFTRPAKTLKSTFDGIFCYNLAISISVVQGFRQTRLPSRHLTFKVKFQGQQVKYGHFSASSKNDQLLISFLDLDEKNA